MAPVSRRSSGVFPNWVQLLCRQVFVCLLESRKPPSDSRSALQQQARAHTPGRSPGCRLQAQTRAQNREQIMPNSEKFFQNGIMLACRHQRAELSCKRMLQGHPSSCASLCVQGLPRPSLQPHCLHPPLAQLVQIDSTCFLMKSWRSKPCPGALPGRSPTPHSRSRARL